MIAAEASALHPYPQKTLLDSMRPVFFFLPAQVINYETDLGFYWSDRILIERVSNASRELNAFNALLLILLPNLV